MNDKPESNSFTPYSIIPIPTKPQARPAWATPDFNPNAVTQVADAGLSPQTAAALARMRQQEVPPPQPKMTPQTMQAVPQGWIQLPNGQFVSPEQYQKLQEMLRKRR